ncbi:immunoglobulin-like domain-containing protein [Schleiferilactobacillus perolens]|nr:SLAP domain-containing protein [Schleiferilactobacillus perolens]
MKKKQIKYIGAVAAALLAAAPILATGVSAVQTPVYAATAAEQSSELEAKKQAYQQTIDDAQRALTQTGQTIDQYKADQESINTQLNADQLALPTTEGDARTQLEGKIVSEKDSLQRLQDQIDAATATQKTQQQNLQNAQNNLAGFEAGTQDALTGKAEKPDQELTGSASENAAYHDGFSTMMDYVSKDLLPQIKEMAENDFAAGTRESEEALTAKGADAVAIAYYNGYYDQLQGTKDGTDDATAKKPLKDLTGATETYARFYKRAWHGVSDPTQFDNTAYDTALSDLVTKGEPQTDSDLKDQGYSQLALDNYHAGYQAAEADYEKGTADGSAAYNSGQPNTVLPTTPYNKGFNDGYNAAKTADVYGAVNGRAQGLGDGYSLKEHADNAGKTQAYKDAYSAAYAQAYATAEAARQGEFDAATGKAYGMADGYSLKDHADNSGKSQVYQNAYDSAYTPARQAAIEAENKAGATAGESDAMAGRAEKSDAQLDDHSSYYIKAYHDAYAANKGGSVTPPVTYPAPEFDYVSGFVQNPTINQGSTFDPNAGISAWTDSSKTTSIPAADWTVTGSVDANKPGTYALTYTIRNSYGQTATLTRTITVTAGTTTGVKFSDTDRVIYVQANSADQYSYDANTGKFTKNDTLASLAMASGWKTGRQAITVDGVTYYQVGANGWLNGINVTTARMVEAAGIVSVTNGVGTKTVNNAVDGQSVKTLANETAWKYFAYANGYYLVANNEWVKADDVRTVAVAAQGTFKAGNNGAALYDEAGNAAGRTLAVNTAWKVTGLKYIDGQAYYQVATHLYVKATAGTQVYTTGNQPVQLYNRDGNAIGSVLGARTSWKVNSVYVHQGRLYYQVATNQFVRIY